MTKLAGALYSPCPCNELWPEFICAEILKGRILFKNLENNFSVSDQTKMKSCRNHQLKDNQLKSHWEHWSARLHNNHHGKNIWRRGNNSCRRLKKTQDRIGIKIVSLLILMMCPFMRIARILKFHPPILSNKFEIKELHF